MDDRVPILDRSDYSVLWVSKTWVDCYDDCHDELRKDIIMSMCIPKELLNESEIERFHAEWENKFQGLEKHGHGKIIVADPGSKIKPCDDPQATFVSLKKPAS